MRLVGKVAVITGAARGIGSATAQKFAAQGAQVVACDVDDALQETVYAITATGGAAIGCVVDVTDNDSIRRMAQEAIAAYGRVDVLVNNAGIVMDAQLKNMTEQQFDRVIDVNLKGTYNCTRALVDTMIARQSGVILNASSIVGLHGNFGQTNYAASKAGVIGMTKTWARELGRHGIRANAICPGFIRTAILDTVPGRVIDAMVDRVPLRRLGMPEEVANTFAFLASDDASYISGAVIEVSGGMTI
jgi:3-oxoacyl-[acyl-carrier protein] reductase